MSEQLPLGIQLDDNASFGNFYPARNQQAVTTLHQIARGRGEHYMLLWGVPGSGCSHLLQAACRETSGIGLKTMYLDMAQLLASSHPGLLDNLESLHLVCLDNVDVLAGKRKWEEALFHCFNRIQASGHRLVVSMHHAPKNAGFVLPDLSSRLAWGVVYQLHGLSEQERLDALCFRAEYRGLKLTKSVAEFLIHHCKRDMRSLADILIQLDDASLTAQRKLTIPFVKSVLEI